MSSIAEYLSDTLTAYGITATALYEASGVHRSRISEILKGKIDPRASTIEALLDGLEKIRPGARLYFCMRLAQSTLPAIKNESIETMDLMELATLLGLITSRLQSEEFLLDKTAVQSNRRSTTSASRKAQKQRS